MLILHIPTDEFAPMSTDEAAPFTPELKMYRDKYRFECVATSTLLSYPIRLTDASKIFRPSFSTLPQRSS